MKVEKEEIETQLRLQYEISTVNSQEHDQLRQESWKEKKRCNHKNKTGRGRSSFKTLLLNENRLDQIEDDFE